MAASSTTAPKQARPVVHLPTNETYDKWSATYDTDGNMLVALDTHALRDIIPRVISTVRPATNDLKITDLGCGTGRATVQLIKHLEDAEQAARLVAEGVNTVVITGLDASAGMLAVARDKVPAAQNVHGLDIRVSFDQWDLIASDTAPPAPAADLILSTLVLEHIEAPRFFTAAKSMLDPRGVLVATNMHHDMGNAFGAPHEQAEQTSKVATAAGFIDPATNIKYRGTSFAHSNAEIVAAAEGAGFAAEPVEELAVEAWMLDGQGAAPLLGPRGAKWIGYKCWAGFIFRLGSMG